MRDARGPSRGVDARFLSRLATGNIMNPFLYVIGVIAILAMIPRPLLAQGNSIEIPAQPPPPQPQASPPYPPQPPPFPPPFAREGRVGAGEAREGASDFGNPRFVFHPIDGGFLRLDLLTGAIASCRPVAADWTCVPGREERATVDREMARLRRDNAALKNALLEHGVPLPNDMKADAPTLSSPASGIRGAPAPAETIPRPPQTVPPAAAAPPPSAKSNEPDRASTDDAEIERIMTIMEKVWRRLVEMMMNIQRDLQKKG
jgi:hypothetical protein